MKKINNDDFENFCALNGIPLWMFRMLPKTLQKDIKNKYYELKKGVKENECEV